MKVIIVLGKARSGKSSVAEMMAELLGGYHLDTGKEVARRFTKLTGQEVTEENKEELRPLLVNLGDLITCIHPENIVRHVLMDLDQPISWLVVSGIRRRQELVGCVDWFSGIDADVHSVWVHVPKLNEYDSREKNRNRGRVLRQMHEAQGDKLELTSDDGAEIIVNDGDLHHLRLAVERFVGHSFGALGVCDA